MACWPPLVTMMSSTRARAPSWAITSTMRSRSSAIPSVGPYCSDEARWSRATTSMTSSNVARSNASVLGKPPASEMMSGRSDRDIRSRMTDDTIPAAREAKRAS